jgi:hypothetical protein
MSLMAMAVLTGLLGSICGRWFKVGVLIPLVAVVIVEVMAFMPTSTWLSAIWSTIVLITSLEIGYVIGSGLTSLLQSSRRGKLLHDLIMYDHSRLSH